MQKHKGQWLKTQFIAKELGQTVGSTQANLRKLAKGQFIKRRIARGNQYFYQIIGGD